MVSMRDLDDDVLAKFARPNPDPAVGKYPGNCVACVSAVDH